MKQIYAVIIAMLFGVAPALAQQPPYVDTACGSWVDDAWVPNGKCAADNDHLRHDEVTGTITSVKGHLVTLQQSTRSVVINDQPALDSKQTGKIAVGRMVVAYGYWQDGTFYATAVY